MTTLRRVLFLPGASGAGRFWQPVAERLPVTWTKVSFDWPGLGHVPPRSDVNGLGDLARLVLSGRERGRSTWWPSRWAAWRRCWSRSLPA